MILLVGVNVLDDSVESLEAKKPVSIAGAKVQDGPIQVSVGVLCLA